MGRHPEHHANDRKQRAHLSALLPLPCPYCPNLVYSWQPWDMDHAHPVAMGGTKHDGLRPAHQSCNRRAGGSLGGELQRQRKGHRFSDSGMASPGTAGGADTREGPRSEAERAELAQVAPGPDGDAWHSAGWLSPFLDIPADAAWPRFMSSPHPSATGSYGMEATSWLESDHGLVLRWWQALALTRILEHDDAGTLVWLEVLLSTARQVGKSVLLRGLALWRLHQGGRFGEEQLVMHTGKDLPVCKEVQRPARAWARTVPGYRVREQNGNEEVSAPDGSRWLVRGKDSVYGYSVSLGMVDEAWGVLPVVVDDGLEPTMPERVSPQLLLVSTAHRLASGLMPVRRASAIASVREPGATLVLEWAAPRDADVEDRAAWRSASPHWTPARERLLEAKATRALAGEADDLADDPDPLASFRSQYLNVWPVRRAPSGHDEALLDPDEWEDLADLAASPPAKGLVVALEDFYGLGASAACVGRFDDGRLFGWGSCFANRAEAVDWAAFLVGAHPGSRVLVGASLDHDDSVTALRDSGVTVMLRTTSNTRHALPLVRQVVADGRLSHDGGVDLGQQVAQCRVTKSREGGGLSVSPKSGRADLVRAFAWAVVEAVQTMPPPRPFVIR